MGKYWWKNCNTNENPGEGLMTQMLDDLLNAFKIAITSDINEQNEKKSINDCRSG